jgi:hypothetical protein
LSPANRATRPNRDVTAFGLRFDRCCCTLLSLSAPRRRPPTQEPPCRSTPPTCWRSTPCCDRPSGRRAPSWATVEPGDDDRVALVASYLANVLALLDAHHAAEDLLLWPPLLERVPDPTPVLHVAAQHVGLDAVQRAAERRLSEWAGGPTVGSAALLGKAMTALATTLGRHLDDQASLVLPLAAEHLTGQEWAALTAYILDHVTGDRPWLVMGLVRAQLTQARSAAQLAAMPVPAQEFWLVVGRAQYEAFVTTLFG